MAEDCRMWVPLPPVSHRGDIRQSPTSRAGVPREAAASKKLRVLIGCGEAELSALALRRSKSLE